MSEVTRGQSKPTIQMEEKIRAANLAKFKDALPTMEIWEEGKNLCVKPAGRTDFIVKSTVDKIAGAVTLYGFTGYMIKVELEIGMFFYIW